MTAWPYLWHICSTFLGLLFRGGESLNQLLIPWQGLPIVHKLMLNIVIAASCFAMPSFVLADDIDEFKNNFEHHLNRVKSGSQQADSLANIVVLEVRLALKRGVDGVDIGKIIVESAPYNENSVNWQLGAVLGAIGVMIESGMIDATNATANDFYRASCDFSETANIYDFVIGIDC